MFRDILLGGCSCVTAVGVAELVDANKWEGLIIAFLSAIIFSVVNIVSKIATSQLEKKGIITHEEKEKIDSVIEDKTEDLLDDGKINDSNK